MPVVLSTCNVALFALAHLQFSVFDQETALNHVRCAGLMGDGFGSTPLMSKKKLIWVVTKMQVLVDRYPSW